MFKILSVTLLLALSFQGDYANIIVPVNSDNNILTLLNKPELKISSKWEEHIMDFAGLIDVDKVLAVVFGYLTDPEVLNFVTFILSDDFGKVIYEFESIAEFKEAYKFLAVKGYDVESFINIINTALKLPPFEKPKADIPKTGTGMTGLIKDLITLLPIDELKKLFATKLETSPEVAELFGTINSPEFIDIMKRMSKNPKFADFKKIFEGYGFDFNYLCTIANDIFGEYYQGVFCG